MEDVIELNPEELKIIEPILKSLSTRAKQSLSLPTLINKWNTFVISVERGYSDSIYDYTNELSVRDLLQTLIDASPKEIHKKIKGAVIPLDVRFKSASKQISKCIFDFKSEEGNINWWWYRIPNRMSDELRNDFRSQEIL